MLSGKFSGSSMPHDWFRWDGESNGLYLVKSMSVLSRCCDAANFNCKKMVWVGNFRLKLRLSCGWSVAKGYQ